jgi:hypothetical protein
MPSASSVYRPFVSGGGGPGLASALPTTDAAKVAEMNLIVSHVRNVARKQKYVQAVRGPRHLQFYMALRPGAILPFVRSFFNFRMHDRFDIALPWMLTG